MGERYRPSEVPAGWRGAPDGVWMHWQPAEPVIAEQGWKVQVSTTVARLQFSLDTVARICFEEGPAFKHRASRAFFETVMGRLRVDTERHSAYLAKVEQLMAEVPAPEALWRTATRYHGAATPETPSNYDLPTAAELDEKPEQDQSADAVAVLTENGPATQARPVGARGGWRWREGVRWSSATGAAQSARGALEGALIKNRPACILLATCS
ncbi:hypothetical protein ACIHEI_05330 [Kitasatospora sp. NPDC051984]|uniref:class III lanthionine synthetase LanKC N-terminal domain-containing protein n=1 Tax=Kitasatospora sp. NPDC051984 TaxID=3364059 RepID=UPI0037CCABBE